MLAGRGDRGDVAAAPFGDAFAVLPDVSAAQEFTEAQLTRDVEVTVRLGADLHLLAATTAVPIAARERAAQLTAAAGVELLVLDATDLRPPAPPPDRAPSNPAPSADSPRKVSPTGPADGGLNPAADGAERSRSSTDKGSTALQAPATALGVGRQGTASRRCPRQRRAKAPMPARASPRFWARLGYLVSPVWCGSR